VSALNFAPFVQQPMVRLIVRHQRPTSTTLEVNRL
jgi:hypothetical protein